MYEEAAWIAGRVAVTSLWRRHLTRGIRAKGASVRIIDVSTNYLVNVIPFVSSV